MRSGEIGSGKVRCGAAGAVGFGPAEAGSGRVRQAWLGFGAAGRAGLG